MVTKIKMSLIKMSLIKMSLKEKVKKVVDELIDSCLMKDCVYDVAVLKCCKELNIEDFTVKRIIESLKWDDRYYISLHPEMLKRLE